MKKIFDETPALWAEEYTDCFNFANTTPAADVEECVSDAVRIISADQKTVYKQISEYQFLTSDQMLVEQLATSAYGHEIAYQHTHFPLHFGETGQHDLIESKALVHDGK